MALAQDGRGQSQYDEIIHNRQGIPVKRAACGPLWIVLTGSEIQLLRHVLAQSM